MLKTGIYDLAQIKKGIPFKSCFGGDKKVSITLYDQILALPNAEELAERILLLFSDERGAYKRTYGKRFEIFDKEVLKLLENSFDKKHPLLFQDVGVSDGKTAVDFFEKIAVLFPKITYSASDYNPTVYVLEKGKLKVTLSHTGKILEIVWPPFVFNTIKRDSYKHYPLNHLVYFFVQSLMVKPLLKAYRAGKMKARELHLFSPYTLAAAKNDPRFVLSQLDLLKPFQEKSHIIRAMNVLNPSYFSQQEFKKVITHLHTALLDNGVLITGSNQEAGSLVHGGIYKKTKEGFEKIGQSGDGSPIGHYLLKLNAI